MVGHIDGDVAVRSFEGCDAVIVRGIPRGSLEQVIFRVDALHALVARGVTCVNGPRAIERTIDKFLASALLARAGVPTPRTIACERPEDALDAFEELGGDVIVKPLFGSMGAGMTRVDDADVAHRVFHALALERAVYYLQETIEAERDVRAFVVGGRVLAAIERVGEGWRANLARGAEARPTELSARAGARVRRGYRRARHRLRRRRPAGRPRAGAQRHPGLAWPGEGDGHRGGARARRSPRGGGRMTTRVPATLALDIGGANTKAARLQGASLRTVSRPYEIWREREALSAVLREVAAEAGPADAVAITMTAELSDAFRTKREGVAFVLDAVEDALGDRPLSVLTTAGELVSMTAARERPWDVAAANWVATALAVAGEHPDALLVDVGSTTADVIPIAGGRVAASGRNDLERLVAGELVYTGVLRTNLAAIAPRVPVRGGWCPVASEYFAISGDVHLVLGHLAQEEYDCPTPDGRPATVAFARERLARLVCSDVDQLDEAEIDAIAAYLHGEQVRQIEEAARRVGPPDGPVVAAGSGAFLGREVAARLGRAVAPAPSGPAAALAALLAATLC